MYHPEKLVQSWECQNEHSDTGNKQEKSRQSEPPVISVDMTLTQSLVKSKTSPLSFTPESRPEDKKKISKGKRRSSKGSSRKQKSSKTSDQDSTTAEKDLKPYWDESCQEMSAKLWSLTKTGWPGLDLNLSNGSVSKTVAKSWFSTSQTYLQKQRWLKISSPLSTSLAVDSTASENTSLLSKKIRIYPETQLKLKWRTWINAARWCYNKAIAILKTTKIGKYDLRKKVMSEVPEWVGSTPYSPRESAIFQAFDAHKAAKKVGGFTKFRRFSDPVQSVRFNKVNFRKGTFYPKDTKGLSFSASEPLPEKMTHDPILSIDRGRWFISFAIDEEPQACSVPYRAFPKRFQRSIALDPGVRTFLTGFDGQKFIDLGAGDIGRIYRLCSHLDDVISRAALAKGSPNKRKRFKLRKAAQRIRVKIRNLIDEAHRKISCYLTCEYQIIYLPKFETSQMVSKSKRKIRSKTVRAMMTWAHYRFKMTLKHQAAKKGCFVVDVTEEYTSKTCTKCGHVHGKLGGSKKFVCPECGHTLDRDHNGAFGIYLKALRDTSSSITDVLYTASGVCQELPG